MSYKESIYLLEYRLRLDGLEANCALASASCIPAIRDMVYQSAIFQTCAGLESYIKFIVLSWSQQLRLQGLHSALPDATRSYIAIKNFHSHFGKYAYVGDEAELVEGVKSRYQNWPIFDVNTPLPHHFDGRILLADCSYPTLKNIKRLFARLGLPTIEHALAQDLATDVSSLIDGFQDVRTALAHSAPPEITVDDVKRLLGDMKRLSLAIDKAFFAHVLSHGGAGCWR